MPEARIGCSWEAASYGCFEPKIELEGYFDWLDPTRTQGLEVGLAHEPVSSRARLEPDPSTMISWLETSPLRAKELSYFTGGRKGGRGTKD